MYDKNSGLVKVWVSLIKAEVFNLSDIPKIYNLREVVEEIVNEG